MIFKSTYHVCLTKTTVTNSHLIYCIGSGYNHIWYSFVYLRYLRVIGFYHILMIIAEINFFSCEIAMKGKQSKTPFQEKKSYKNNQLILLGIGNGRPRYLIFFFLSDSFFYNHVISSWNGQLTFDYNFIFYFKSIGWLTCLEHTPCILNTIHHQFDWNIFQRCQRILSKSINHWWGWCQYKILKN